MIWLKRGVLIVLAVLAAACSPEVGSDEAVDYAKQCVFR